MGPIKKPVYLELDFVSIAQYGRMQKHFSFTGPLGVDTQVVAVRSIKSPYEIALMEKAGKIHRHVLEDLVPVSFNRGDR